MIDYEARIAKLEATVALLVQESDRTKMLQEPAPDAEFLPDNTIVLFSARASGNERCDGCKSLVSEGKPFYMVTNEFSHRAANVCGVCEWSWERIVK